MKATCRHCGKDFDVTKHGKLAPHNVGGIRCPGSGKRVANLLESEVKSNHTGGNANGIQADARSND